MGLAALYHQRWEVDAVFDELKTHLLQRRRVLRSKTADLVRQEFYGWVLAHYAVRWLMHQAATDQRLSDRSLSFTGKVQLLRCAQPQSGTLQLAKGCTTRACSSGTIRPTQATTAVLRETSRPTSSRNCWRLFKSPQKKYTRAKYLTEQY